MTTPFDGSRTLWYTLPASVPDGTAEALVARIKATAPNVTGLLVKAWNWDYWALRAVAKKPRAVASIADLRYWVDLLHANGLKCYAWGVARGERVSREITLMQQIASAGVDAMVADVEVGEFYWQGTAAGATAIARAIADTGVHLGICFDYRGAHAIHSNAVQWMPYAGSLHPMAYHWHFQRSASSVMTEMARILAPRRLPIVPALQGYSLRGRPYLASDIPVTARIALAQPGVVGVSWFRIGQGLALGSEDGIGPVDLRVIGLVDPAMPQEPALFAYTDRAGVTVDVLAVDGGKWRTRSGVVSPVPLRAA